ncbi:MAG: DMT family transporter [Bacteroidales bacterium]|nr:DMT family transporter [Bacteroidales bacterium]
MFWHILALLTACIWGSTFAASSLLIRAGLTPAEIMCLRFIIAYLLMLPFELRGMIQRARAHRFSDRAALWMTIRDEGLFVLLGLTGGSLYFLSENYAVKLTNFTSTVALIVCTCPIWTALLNRLIWRSEHITNRFIFGSVTAVAGVTLVVLNGVFVLDDNPWVILLSFGAALMWAIYSLILKVLDRRYSSAVITRKVFWWGVLTMLPVVCIEARMGESQLWNLTDHAAAWGESLFNLDLITQPEVWVTLLFLSLIASLGCFLTWNIVCKRLSIVTASNYLYFNPVTSLWMGAILLGEQVTWPALIGCAVTIAGVYLCNRK